MAWHLSCSGWSILVAELPSEVVINLGNVMDIDGTSTYLTTGPVVVGHSLTDWVLLELELELWLLELHWGSAWLGLIS